MFPNLTYLRAVAKVYRREELSSCAHGFVLIYQGRVYGWKRSLDCPSSEKPGAFAVDAAGNFWIATGGNDHDGATSWQFLSPFAAQGCGDSLAAPAKTRSGRAPIKATPESAGAGGDPLGGFPAPSAMNFGVQGHAVSPSFPVPVGNTGTNF